MTRATSLWCFWSYLRAPSQALAQARGARPGRPTNVVGAGLVRLSASFTHWPTRLHAGVAFFASCRVFSFARPGYEWVQCRSLRSFVSWLGVVRTGPRPPRLFRSCELTRGGSDGPGARRPQEGMPRAVLDLWELGCVMGVLIFSLRQLYFPISLLFYAQVGCGAH